MVNERLVHAFEVVARLFGVALVAAGALLSTSSPVLGVPLAAFGLLFAFRPTIAAEVLDGVASLL